jgi:uncharacterized membrane protein
MPRFLTVGFLAILVVFTLLAIRIWYTRRGASVSEAERRVFARFILGLAMFWLVAIAGYFGGPLLSMMR